LPITFGGNAFAVKVSHFFATLTLSASALFVIGATVMKTNPTALINFRLANMVNLPASLTDIAYVAFKLAHPNAKRDFKGALSALSQLVHHSNKILDLCRSISG
jgi:hypothetical protein